MQDQEGNTILNLQSRRGSPSPARNPAVLRMGELQDEEGYTMLNLQHKRDSPSSPSPARNPGSSQAPQCLWISLWVSCTGNIILVVAVAALVSQLVSEKQQTLTDAWDGPGSRHMSKAGCSTCLEHFQSQLKQNLCGATRQSSAEGSGCKLCPRDWQLHRDKCYWVSREFKPWDRSHEDCVSRSSQLLLIQDQEELDFIKELTQASRYFWIGLSIPSPEKGWTWLNGAQFNQTLFPLSGQAEGNGCAAVTENLIHAEICGAAYQCVCQKTATEI